MRLALILNRYFPHGGLQIQALRIAMALMQRGHEVTILTRQWIGEFPVGLVVREFPNRAWTNHGRDDQLAEHVLPYFPDFEGIIGFMPMTGLDVFYAADVCFQAQARARYGEWYRWTPRYRHRVAREAAVFAHSNANILTLHPQAARPFQQCYGTADHRFQVIPSGIRPFIPVNRSICQDYRQEIGVSQEKPLLLFVGSGFHTKGLDRVLYALSHCQQGAHLVVIGQGKTSIYRYMARFLNLSVDFLGVRNDVSQWMATADLLIHPARRENTGNVILEAIVSGLPVITVDHCGFAFHVLRSRMGKVLASPFRRTALSQAIDEMILKLPNHREIWRQCGIVYGQQHDFYHRAEYAAMLITEIVMAKHQKSR